MLKKALYQYASLFVIVTGAGGFFLANIILKEVLPPVEFGELSLIITYLSLMYIFGIFGFEQVFMRLSEVHVQNVIVTQKSQLKVMVFTSVGTSVIAAICFRMLYPSIAVNFSLLLLGTFSMVSVMSLFTIFRLNSDFFIAQIIVNFWKIALFLLALVILVFKQQLMMANAILIVIITGFVVSFVYLKRHIRFQFTDKHSTKEIFGYFYQFFISILIFSFLTFGDRFIFNDMFGIAEFGNYYYLTNFFLAPFSIFQNYIGFKHLVKFKNSFDHIEFTRLTTKILGLGSILSIFLAAAALISDHWQLLNFNFRNYTGAILILLFIGITRLYYSAIAALLEARALKSTLKAVNFFYLTFLILFVSVSMAFISTITHLVFVILVLWLSRCIVFRIILFRQLKDI